jgi:hypothetical protein
MRRVTESARMPRISVVGLALIGWGLTSKRSRKELTPPLAKQKGMNP